MAHEIHLETTNFNEFTFLFEKIKTRVGVTNFLRQVEACLEEDDAFSLYSAQFDGAMCYKISFNSRYNSVEGKWYMFFVFELVDHAEGEEIVEEVYVGTNREKIEQLIWQHRKVINEGILDT